MNEGSQLGSPPLLAQPESAAPRRKSTRDPKHNRSRYPEGDFPINSETAWSPDRNRREKAKRAKREKKNQAAGGLAALQKQCSDAVNRASAAAKPFVLHEEYTELIKDYYQTGTAVKQYVDVSKSLADNTNIGTDDQDQPWLITEVTVHHVREAEMAADTSDGSGPDDDEDTRDPMYEKLDSIHVALGDTIVCYVEPSEPPSPQSPVDKSCLNYGIGVVKKFRFADCDDADWSVECQLEWYYTSMQLINDVWALYGKDETIMEEMADYFQTETRLGPGELFKCSELAPSLRDWVSTKLIICSQPVDTGPTSAPVGDRVLCRNQCTFKNQRFEAKIWHPPQAIMWPMPSAATIRYLFNGSNDTVVNWSDMAGLVVGLAGGARNDVSVYVIGTNPDSQRPAIRLHKLLVEGDEEYSRVIDQGHTILDRHLQATINIRGIAFPSELKIQGVGLPFPSPNMNVYEYHYTVRVSRAGGVVAMEPVRPPESSDLHGLFHIAPPSRARDPFLHTVWNQLRMAFGREFRSHLSAMRKDSYGKLGLRRLTISNMPLTYFLAIFDADDVFKTRGPQTVRNGRIRVNFSGLDSIKTFFGDDNCHYSYMKGRCAEICTPANSAVPLLNKQKRVMKDALNLAVRYEVRTMEMHLTFRCRQWNGADFDGPPLRKRTAEEEAGGKMTWCYRKQQYYQAQ